METWKLKGAKKLATGGDSTVYKKRNRVVKVFYSYHAARGRATPFFFSTLKNYKAVTDGAIAFLKERPITGTIKIGGVTYSYSFRIIPILEIGIAKNAPACLCEYVPGVTIDNLLSYSQTTLVNAELEFKSLRDATKERWMRHFKEVILADSKAFSALLAVLNTATDTLNRGLNVRGIRIVSPNVKVDVEFEKREVSFIVTDLCANVNDLDPYLFFNRAGESANFNNQSPE